MGARGPRKGLLNCSVGIGASHARRGNPPEEGRGRDKRFLGALARKDWLRRENHKGEGKFSARSSLLLPH